MMKLYGWERKSIKKRRVMKKKDVQKKKKMRRYKYSEKMEEES